MPPARSAAAVVRQIRLWAGLVLFTYLTTHFLNHALGLVSVDAMLAGREWFVLLWRSRLGTLALYSAFTVHLLLAYWSLYRRRTLRMPAWEATQLILGLTIPLLLVSHVVGTRLAHELAGTRDSYALVLLVLWTLDPVAGWRQAIVLVIAWLHGCVGLHFWLRLRAGYRRCAWLIYSGALLLPVLALLGFAGGGREIGRRAENPAYVTEVMAAARRPNAEQRLVLGRVSDSIFWGHLGMIALVLAARAVREHVRRRQGVRISYPDGREVLVPVGFTILEASRFAGIPHASVCGGRGRCSTCRVRVIRGAESLPRPASTSCACSGEWARPPTCDWPARCVRPATSRWRRSWPRERGRRPRWAARRATIGRAKSSPSRCCSPICAASPDWPSASCRTTWCSS
jgi:adenylate cyclase